MSVPTFTPPVGPSPGTWHKPTVNLWEADFGDGYSQPTPKGINHIRKSTSLSWNVLTYEQMLEITDFFERMGGHLPFFYRPYGERVAVKWTCKDWTLATEGGIWTLQAELVQSLSNAV